MNPRPIFVVTTIAGDVLSAWDLERDARDECRRLEDAGKRACMSETMLQADVRPARGHGRHSVVRKV